MFAQVRILNGYSSPLLYQIPDTLNGEHLVGRLVQVPLRNKIVSALVIEQMATPPAGTHFAIKKLIGLEPFPQDPHYFNFIKKLSHYYGIEPLHIIERIHQFLLNEKKKKRAKKIAVRSNNAINMVTLTHEQQAVCDFIQPSIAQQQYVPTLLHGITGSGKTEVYKKLITHALDQGKTVLLLLPEVTLAIQFERLLMQQLPTSYTIIGFHSAAALSEKRELWQRLIDQKPTLIIGVHLPILLPLPNVGLIIVDEEHEVGYQEKKHPKINSKDAAIWRAHLHNIPIVLGSATPSMSSLYNVKNKHWHMFHLKQRFAGALPTLETVLLTDKKQRKNFWISKRLEDAIKDRLARKEQVIIFLNRRGYSFFVQCKACTFIFTCTNCSVSLTLHTDTQLRCHYCGIGMQQPHTCPQCKADESNFLKKGIGTQQVVSILEKLFPYARIGRADMDTTAKKKEWQQTMRDFDQGALDILVGTQTITKGFHFPRVTLVGILWADLNLNFPMYNASETTLQQLIQVAGRAGRATAHSTVIVQAMADHPIFQYLNETDYPNFYEQEIEQRAMVNYPPCTRLAEIELKHHDEAALDREAGMLVQELCALQKYHGYTITILGPAKPPVHKIKNSFARKIYLKGTAINELVALFANINKNSYSSSLFFTPNPLQ